jgi:hypothetical protein
MLNKYPMSIGAVMLEFSFVKDNKPGSVARTHTSATDSICRS